MELCFEQIICLNGRARDKRVDGDLILFIGKKTAKFDR